MSSLIKERLESVSCRNGPRMVRAQHNWDKAFGQMWFLICRIGQEFPQVETQHMDGRCVSGWFVDAPAGVIVIQLFQFQPLWSDLGDRVRVIPCSRLDNAG